MSVNIRMNDVNLEEVDDVKLHYMPCKINANEEANVSKYFAPYIKITENNEMESSFRGYPLNGKEISIPEGYKGLICSEYKKPDCDTEARNLYVTGQFSKFNYWNYDKIPSNGDSITRALDWIDIAKAIHSPIDEEEQ